MGVAGQSSSASPGAPAMCPNVLCVDLHSGSRLGRQLKELVASDCRVMQLRDYRCLTDDRAVRRVTRRRKFESMIIIAPAHMESTVEEIIRHRAARLGDLPVILMMDAEQPEMMVRLLRLGAADFITPPLKRGEIQSRIWRLVGQRRGEDRVSARLSEKLGLAGLVGEDPCFRECVEKIPLYARCDATVMIEGETGTGKDVCARAIHYLSARSKKPFVSVNCAAIPLELVENELFGHERSAYTGASSSYDGLVCAAEGGTLFLDEIGCLPFAAQAKLLGLLQDKTYRPLGSTRTHAADIRLIAATNTPVEEALHEGRLRRDLYYRLNVLPLRLPTLKDRSEDILLLADHFLRKFSVDGQLPPHLSNGAAQMLLQHDWPGNVRELEHVLERAVILADGDREIRESEILLPTTSATESESFQEAKARVVAKFEVSYINALLAAHEGNITRAAAAAGKNRRAFWELIRKHGIDPSIFRRGRGEARSPEPRRLASS